MKYDLSDNLKKQLSKEMVDAPTKQEFHARVQKEIYPRITGTVILQDNNIEIYHYE